MLLSGSLTYLAPLGPNAVEEAEVVDLAVLRFYVQLGEAKVQPVAAGHADLPLTHAVVGVRPRVTQGGQRPAGGTEYRWATAITCRVAQTSTCLLKLIQSQSFKCSPSLPLLEISEETFGFGLISSPDLGLYMTSNKN